MNLPTIQHLHERVSYNPQSGAFVWKANRIAARVGTEAGQNRSGYRVIRIQGRMFPAHRIAWALMTGAWPSHDIDHRNLDKSDNRWDNLRPASKRENARNTGIRADNKSGFKGVCWDKGRRRWRADIRLPSIRKHLGLFDDPAIAHAAYSRAVSEHFGDYGRVS